MTTTPSSGERALVLGGGGGAGYAWEIGVLAGLLDAGLDVTDAELIVGTSAGSTAAANVGNASPADLYAAFQAATPRPAGSGGGRPSVTDHLAKMDRIIADAADPADLRRKLGAAALDKPSSGSRWRDVAAARLAGPDWPRQLLFIVVVDAHTGEPVVFDNHSGVDLADAVAASTSGPGAPAHPVGDGHYIDGGYRRNENADLAAGYRRVLVLSPFSGRTRVPLEWGSHLAAQVDDLRASGSAVETVFPDGAARDIFAGTNQMDPSLFLPAAQAGHDQGRALAEPLTAFWR